MLPLMLHAQFFFVLLLAEGGGGTKSGNVQMKAMLSWKLVVLG